MFCLESARLLFDLLSAPVSPSSLLTAFGTLISVTVVHA
jgi:hypothetical protein